MARARTDRRSRLALPALALALIAWAALLFDGYGGRHDWWSAERAVGAVPALIGLGAVALVLGLIARFRHRHQQMIAVVAILVAALLVGVLSQYLWHIRQVPLLVDLATDPANPPQFTGLPIRADRIAHVPLLDRPGYAAFTPEERWRAVQADAYPSLRPIAVAVPPPAVIAAVGRMAARRGWVVAVSQPAQGHIELTVPSRFFGYRDDLVVRAQPRGRGALVDLRGVARTGLSDHGRIAGLIHRVERDLSRLR